MNRQHKILLLRISFWIGAIIDALAAIQLLIPSLWASSYGLTIDTANGALNLALVTAAALMLGWTGLLIWADRKPMERKGILLLTVFPVVFGMAANNVYTAASGLTTIQSVLPLLAMQCILSTLFVFSYFNARNETPSAQ
jgi:uncharacterized membrane protein